MRSSPISARDLTNERLTATIGINPVQKYSPIGADAQGSTVTLCSELIFALCEIQNIEIVIINQGEPLSFEEELAQDVIEIILKVGSASL